MRNVHLMNELLNERLELTERVEYWVGSEAEEERLHSEIDALTRQINKLQGGRN